MPRKLTQDIVEQWLSLVKDKFNVRDIWQEIGIESPEGKTHLRVILGRIEAKGSICSNGGGGNYRKLNIELVPIDWRSADPNNIVPLKWPFELEKYASIYPKNIIVVAGGKQAGKTTFLYNFIKLNMSQYQIDLFNSETGPEQMKDRFDDLGITDNANFNVYERYDNYSDVVRPDVISVIDYLDLNSEFYLAGAEIDAIFRKLTSGIAVIGMQIPPPAVSIIKGVKKTIERDYAYGGGTTAKRAFIYLSMLSNHMLKLRHAKKHAQKNLNPENMMWSYEFDEQGQFTNIKRYYPTEELKF